MKHYFFILLLLASFNGFAQTSERPRVGEATMVNTDAGSVSLQSLLNRKKTMLVVIEPSQSKAASWLEQIRNSKSELVKANAIIVISYLPNQEAKVNALIAASPGLRIVRDPEFEASKSLSLTAFPVLLGVQASAAVDWQHAGDPPGGRSVVDFIEAWVK